MKSIQHIKAVLVAAVLLLTCALANGEVLFDSYLIPSFDGLPNTEYSRWSVFYAPNGGLNYPDATAPNGTYGSASSAGFSNPGDWSPANPWAYWHVDNPTIRQTNGGHFIIGPGTMGNIYSPGVVGDYVLSDTTPYALGTVVFQFQTDGQPIDYSTIRLRYFNGTEDVELAPDEYIREYRSTASSFGGYLTRNAFQWDLTDLDIFSYEIVFHSVDSSMSFQEALLDTSESYATVVPEKRHWIGVGAGTWSTSSNWQESSSSVTNGNVHFVQSGAADISLDGARTVGELVFDTPYDVTISGASTLTANTGITTTEAATGTYVIQTPYAMGAFNLMDIEGGEVRVEGSVSGAYGMLKAGNGVLILAGNNTFGTPTAGISIQGGTLRIEGTNTYGGSTAVMWGTLEIASDAPVSAPGALGNGTSNVVLGLSDAVYSTPPEPAVLVIDGNHTVARNISVEQGSYEKRLGAKNTNGVATYSGNVSLLGSGANATSLKLFAQGTEDVVRFTGTISGGSSTSSLRINADGEKGTVAFSGVDKSYGGSTAVHSGTLWIEDGTSVTGNGNWTVYSGAVVRIDGSLDGNGSFDLQAGASLMGSGALNRAISVANGASIAPGNSVGILTTGTQEWGAGGIYQWQIRDLFGTAGNGWDMLQINGELNVSATDASPFVIRISTLGMDDLEGLLGGFVSVSDYEWVIASASDGISGFDPAAFQLDATGFVNLFNGYFAITNSGDDILLTYTPIPEPAVLLWVSVLVLAGLLAHRRHRNYRRNSTTSVA